MAKSSFPISLLRASLLSAALLYLMSVGGAVGAQPVYKSVDENGRVTYTDDPHSKGAEEVELSDLIVQPSIPVAPRPPKNRDTDAAPDSYQVSITSPAPETHLNPGQWDLSVAVATKPAVHASHRLNILDNGEVISSEGAATTISNVLRGSHSLQAQVVDQYGRVLGSSDVVMVYVHRPTVAR